MTEHGPAPRARGTRTAASTGATRLDAPGSPSPLGPGPSSPIEPGDLSALAPLAVLVLVMLAALALREMASLVVPVLFGLFLALVASPLVAAIERRGARHAVALAGAVLVVLVVVVIVAIVAVISVAELVLEVPKYEDRFRGIVEDLRTVLAGFGVTLDVEAITSLVPPSSVVAFLRPVASAISSATLALFVLTLTMVYAMVGSTSLQARVRASLPDGNKLLHGMERFGFQLRRYLIVRAQLGLFAAVLSAVLLVVLGVPFAFLWAFLVFAASFIPNIGTFIALVPPALLALLTGGVVPAVVVIVGYTLINFAQDQFLQPVVMGAELNLTPLVVFLSVLAWTWILGPAGALLAVPLTVGLVALLEAHPATEGFAAVFRNRLDEPPGLVDGLPPASANP